MKRIISICIIISLFVLIFTPFSVSAAWKVNYNISVADTTVNSWNADDILGDRTASYDVSTNTLTLNNASFTGVNGIHYDYAESSTAPLTIIVKGTNTISTYNMDELRGVTSSYGIRTASFSSGPGLVIKGDGTLNINPGFINNTAYGIAVSGNIRFEGKVKVNVKVPLNVSGTTGWGINSEKGEIQIGDSSRITVEAPDTPLSASDGKTTFFNGYIPLVKAGSSSGNISFKGVNPKPSNYIGDHSGRELKYKYISIQKAPKNPMTVTGKTVKAYAKKNTAISKSKAFSVKNAKGAVTFKKLSGNKNISIGKSGKITVKKGLSKGKTYSLKVKVHAAGTSSYAPITKKATVKIKVV